jgi:hypothetical protein
MAIRGECHAEASTIGDHPIEAFDTSPGFLVPRDRSSVLMATVRSVLGGRRASHDERDEQDRYGEHAHELLLWRKRIRCAEFGCRSSD